MHQPVLALLAACALALSASLAGGCGNEEPDVPAVTGPEETIDPLPALERGWEPYLSRRNGLWFGRPPGWKVSRRGVATLIEAPDRLVVMSLSTDRTNEALAGDPRNFAVQTFSALGGYEGELDPSEPEPFPHRYDAYIVRGTGVAADSGVRQRLRLIVLEREGAAVVTVLIAENAREGAPQEAKQALEIVRTLRTRPVG